VIETGEGKEEMGKCREKQKKLGALLLGLREG